MKCPVDGAELMMSERQGIEVDYCPQCRGVWLDRGELDKIIERSAAESARYASASPEPRYDERRDHRDYDDRSGKPRKRRESFLGDIFDFG